MIELAIVTGRPLHELERLDDGDLATFVDVARERALRRG